eukprot:CAMPEP_0194068128 /NCGR_PEP_ID=MMETSP0009_2-20130614/86924_1 /TAXON_ID=210454 /ORGANISM="Grammatophora oceanica, Strain CCMP 410" /LENGTH=45 /DNA_ID= /DNA_START= /DNA_END= /DNA_ORIENTATION=
MMVATRNGSHPHLRAKGELMERNEEEEDGFACVWDVPSTLELFVW